MCVFVCACLCVLVCVCLFVCACLCLCVYVCACNVFIFLQYNCFKSRYDARAELLQSVYRTIGRVSSGWIRVFNISATSHTRDVGKYTHLRVLLCYICTSPWRMCACTCVCACISTDVRVQALCAHANTYQVYLLLHVWMSLPVYCAYHSGACSYVNKCVQVMHCVCLASVYFSMFNVHMNSVSVSFKCDVIAVTHSHRVNLIGSYFTAYSRAIFCA